MTWKRLGWAAVVIALLLFIPYTRRAVLVILPLGKGVDDVLFLAAAIAALIIFGGRWYIELKADTKRIMEDETEWSRTKKVFLVIILLAVLAVVIMAWMFMSMVMTQ